jgi:hypothetical protein
MQEEAASASFAGDGHVWSHRVAREPGVFTTVPVLELFQAELGFGELPPEAIARTYRAQGRLRFSRAFSSRPQDLFLPADVEALVDRSLRWEGDSREDLRQWQLSVTAVAINLFGAQGSRPTFLNYASDEFRNALLLSLTEPVGGEEPSWTIGVEQQTRLFGFRENEFELDSTAQFASAATSTVSLSSAAVYRWQRPGYPDWRLLQRLEQEPFYRHEERGEVTAEFENGNFTGSEITLGHRSTLVVGANGEISLFGDLGWIADPEQYDSGVLNIIGLQVGLEGRLSY